MQRLTKVVPLTWPWQDERCPLGISHGCPCSYYGASWELFYSFAIAFNNPSNCCVSHWRYYWQTTIKQYLHRLITLYPGSRRRYTSSSICKLHRYEDSEDNFLRSKPAFFTIGRNFEVVFCISVKKATISLRSAYQLCVIKHITPHLGKSVP